jgi:hypothetical protein
MHYESLKTHMICPMELGHQSGYHLNVMRW